MKRKHIKVRIEQCLSLAKLSNCPRRRFGALLLDPERNQVLCDSYNGAPRGGGELCGGDTCLRNDQDVVSGTQMEIGCHHAEMNLICNAAASGIPAGGSWLFVTGEPCTLCAKLIHHAGVARVIVIGGGYAGINGTQYLQEHDVPVEVVEGPQDPRLNQKIGGEGEDPDSQEDSVVVVPDGVGQDDSLDLLSSESIEGEMAYCGCGPTQRAWTSDGTCVTCELPTGE